MILATTRAVAARLLAQDLVRGRCYLSTVRRGSGCVGAALEPNPHIHSKEDGLRDEWWKEHLWRTLAR